jgi:glutaminyl-tRNA synthetase
VRGTLHWVSAPHAIDAEVRLYDYLFLKTDPEEVEDGADFKSNINRNSLEVLESCRLEPSLAGSTPGSFFQFERLGYFCADPDSSENKPVFNRTVTLKDTWAKIEKKNQQTASSG